MKPRDYPELAQALAGADFARLVEAVETVGMLVRRAGIGGADFLVTGGAPAMAVRVAPLDLPARRGAR
jgi:hypothetical protein